MTDREDYSTSAVLIDGRDGGPSILSKWKGFGVLYLTGGAKDMQELRRLVDLWMRCLRPCESDSW